MAKLDFNAINRPVLELTMMDKDHTVITVTSPTEGLVEELQATMPELQKVLAPGDQDTVETARDLAARLISCNKEGLQVSADDLRTKYWPVDRLANMENMLVFFKVYVDFVKELNSEKN